MSKEYRVLIDAEKMDLIITRLCYQLIENYENINELAIVGIQPRGTFFSDRIVSKLKEIDASLNPLYGKIDPTFYRDDFRTKEAPLVPNATEFDFLIDSKKVVMVDDVFFTGRTVRAALDAMHDFGRPAKVDLMVLINRRFSKELPLRPDFIGERVDSVAEERVTVEWKETHDKDQVLLYRDLK